MEVLACQYLEIVPNFELLDDDPKYERLGTCNSFSIKSESGWGVFDVKNNRTVLTPVFDEPIKVIIGPMGYIACINGKYGITDADGSLILPFIYDSVEITKKELKCYEDKNVITSYLLYTLDDEGYVGEKVFSWEC